MSRFLPICAVGLAALSCQPPVYWHVREEARREPGGQWIVRSPDLPGIKAYGASRREALIQWQPLASRTLAEDMEDGEFVAEIKPFRPSGELVPIVDLGLLDGTVYGGELPDFISSTMGADMDTGIGFDLSAGVRIRDRVGLKLGYGLKSANASGGPASITQRLGQFTSNVEIYFPLMPPRTADDEPNWRRELVVSFAYVPDATLLDGAGDGFRDGSGWGGAVLFRGNEPPWFGLGRGKVSLGMGLGYRRLAFREYKVAGSGSSSVKMDLDMFSFLAGFEFWF